MKGPLPGEGCGLVKIRIDEPDRDVEPDTEMDEEKLMVAHPFSLIGRQPVPSRSQLCIAGPRGRNVEMTPNVHLHPILSSYILSLPWVVSQVLARLGIDTTSERIVCSCGGRSVVDDETLMALRVLAHSEVELYFAGDTDSVQAPDQFSPRSRRPGLRAPSSPVLLTSSSDAQVTGDRAHSCRGMSPRTEIRALDHLRKMVRSPISS